MHQQGYLWRLFVLAAAFISVFPEPVSAAEDDAVESTGTTLPGENDWTSAGLFAEAIELETINTTLQFGGFIQADFIHDFDPAGSRYQFVVSSIPVEGEPEANGGSRDSFSMKQSRLTLDTTSDTSSGQIRTNFEGDFFGSGRAFEILHAYAEWNGLLVGKTETVFQDPASQPTTLDYEGPDGELYIQQLQLRYTRKISDSLEWSMSIEEPDGEIYSETGGNTEDDFPDVPFHVRWEKPYGQIQLGGIYRQLSYQDDGGRDASTSAWGVSVTGSVNLDERNTFMGQAAYGEGIARYFQAFNGEDADGIYDPDGHLSALNASAFLAAIEHQWNSQLVSTLSADYAKIGSHPGRLDDGIRTASSIHLNLIWTPRPLWMVGGEVMWGKRKNVDGASGDATRVQLSIQYSFR